MGIKTENMFDTLMDKLKQAKPEERGELARRYAITITALEKAKAYYMLYVNGRADNFDVKATVDATAGEYQK